MQGGEGGGPGAGGDLREKRKGHWVAGYRVEQSRVRVLEGEGQRLKGGALVQACQHAWWAHRQAGWKDARQEGNSPQRPGHYGFLFVVNWSTMFSSKAPNPRRRLAEAEPPHQPRRRKRPDVPRRRIRLTASKQRHRARRRRSHGEEAFHGAEQARPAGVEAEVVHVEAPRAEGCGVARARRPEAGDDRHLEQASGLLLLVVERVFSASEFRLEP